MTVVAHTVHTLTVAGIAYCMRLTGLAPITALACNPAAVVVLGHAASGGNGALVLLRVAQVTHVVWEGIVERLRHALIGGG